MDENAARHEAATAS